MKSSSQSQGYELSAATWRKSTYSGGTGGNCLEVAVGPDGPGGTVPVRDSKTPHIPGLVFRARVWSVFVTEVKAGTSVRPA
ncbi:DUF397 domain-containing protein [Streptomyces sp. NPDC127033]|uniref:DUF397 domain-containing protein n=1 Tax=Streptomyces sp. NPDC127033 TaxID=3347110 RepID=UPI0036467E3D